MTFRATVACSDPDREQAVTVLRARLHAMTMAASAGTPDWVNLVLEGPHEVPGLHGRPRFVWVGTVETSLGPQIA